MRRRRHRWVCSALLLCGHRCARAERAHVLASLAILFRARRDGANHCDGALALAPEAAAARSQPAAPVAFATAAFALAAATESTALSATALAAAVSATRPELYH